MGKLSISKEKEEEKHERDERWKSENKKGEKERSIRTALRAWRETDTGRELNRRNEVVN